jgi:hypothetical protein
MVTVAKNPHTISQFGQIKDAMSWLGMHGNTFWRVEFLE